MHILPDIPAFLGDSSERKRHIVKSIIRFDIERETSVVQHTCIGDMSEAKIVYDANRKDRISHHEIDGKMVHWLERSRSNFAVKLSGRLDLRSERTGLTGYKAILAPLRILGCGTPPQWLPIGSLLVHLYLLLFVAQAPALSALLLALSMRILATHLLSRIGWPQHLFVSA